MELFFYLQACFPSVLLTSHIVKCFHYSQIPCAAVFSSLSRPIYEISSGLIHFRFLSDCLFSNDFFILLTPHTP